MRRLLVDVSYVLKRYLYAASKLDSAMPVEYDGKTELIGDYLEAYELFLKNYVEVLSKFNFTPGSTVLVKDGASCKTMRRNFYGEYCLRPKGPKEFSEQLRLLIDKVEETVLLYGGMSVGKDYVEADDIIYSLAEKEDCVIWSGDADLLGCRGDVWLWDTLNPEKFLGLDKKFIPVYKALIGDKSDNYPGARGFGEAAFVKMLEKFGIEALDDLLDMLENKSLHELKELASEFKPFVKVLEYEDEVYASYSCAKFYHPGWDLNWKQLFPKGNGDLPQWEPSEVLITTENYERLLPEIAKDLVSSPFNTYDIESYTSEEGLDWSERNRSKSKPKGPLDVFGQIMTGFSINCGSNNHKTYYFSVKHRDTDNLTLEQAKYILNLLPEEKVLGVHNSSFELVVTKRHFDLRFDRGFLPENTYDTRILARDMDENEDQGLKHWSSLIMGYSQTTFEEVLGTAKDMSQLSGRQVLNYGCDDSICTAQLLKRALIVLKYEDIFKGYLKCDLAAQFMYANSFLTGITFDLEEIKRQQQHNEVVFKETTCNLEDFILDISWEETVVGNTPVSKAIRTPEDLAEFKKRATEAANTPEYKTITHRWPGCEFIPAAELTPAEIKRLFSIYTGGEVLKTSVRLLDKLAAIVDERGYPEFAEVVAAEDLSGLNSLCEDTFIPKPEFNPRSPVQVGKLFYEVFGFPVRVRNKLTDVQRSQGRSEGNPATNELALKHAILFDAKDPSIKLFLENLLGAKSCLTEDSLFFSPYQQMPNPIDGRVHPQSGQSMAVSGRANANTPNISQVSKKSKVRDAYIPNQYPDDTERQDTVWVSFDFSSQELAHIACHTGDPNMLSCFIGDSLKDLHSMTGVAIWNKKNEQQLVYDSYYAIRKAADHALHKAVIKTRNQAKTTNFLKAYLGTAMALALKLMIPEEEAQEMLDAADEMFPMYPLWQKKMTEIHRERGYAVTPMGHRRRGRFDGTWKDEHELRGMLNAIIQGGSAEQVKAVLSKLWKLRILDMFSADFMFSVHDQVDFTVPRKNVVKFIKAVHPIMTAKFAGMEMDFRSSIEIGPNFGQLVEIGDEIDEEKILKVLATF